MKGWLTENFLPMWAKETVLRDNRALLEKIRNQEEELRIQQAYIRGLEMGLKAVKRGGSQ